MLILLLGLYLYTHEMKGPHNLNGGAIGLKCLKAY